MVGRRRLILTSPNTSQLGLGNRLAADRVELVIVVRGETDGYG